MNILGIDIGGSGIKGAVVNAATGKLLTERERIDTPIPAQPAAVVRAVARLATRFGWKGPIGVGFPGIVRDQCALSAANLHPAWKKMDLRRRLGTATGCPVHALNDADAAGLAEMTFGAGRKVKGSVLVITLGTGIGTALFRDGVLFPNLEFGHIKYKDGDIEAYAADSARKNEDLRWSQWGRRVNEALNHFHALLSTDLIIVGGGVSSKWEKFLPFLHVPTRVVPARLGNRAGMIGAAVAAARHLPKSKLKVRSFTPPAAPTSRARKAKKK